MTRSIVMRIHKNPSIHGLLFTARHFHVNPSTTTYPFDRWSLNLNLGSVTSSRFSLV
ncbi:unnamed protein product [Brassica rapa subsp. narinosa]